MSKINPTPVRSEMLFMAKAFHSLLYVDMAAHLKAKHHVRQSSKEAEHEAERLHHAVHACEMLALHARKEAEEMP
jgi:hypothetical protein